MEGEEAAGVRSKVPPCFTLLLAPKKRETESWCRFPDGGSADAKL